MSTKSIARLGAGLRRTEGSLDSEDGDNDIIRMDGFNGGISIAVHPDAESSMSVEYTLSSYSAVEDESAKWFTWPGETVAESTVDTLGSPVTAIRITAVTGAGSYEVVG
jgi:hypothetical protein